MVTSVAFSVFHVSVAACPGLMVLGLAVNDAVGYSCGGGGGGGAVATSFLWQADDEQGYDHRDDNLHPLLSCWLQLFLQSHCESTRIKFTRGPKCAPSGAL